MSDTKAEVIGRALTTDEIERLCGFAVATGLLEVGNGESLANNKGPDLVRYGAIPGEPWCAAFVDYCFAHACYAAKIKHEIKRSLNAKRLGKNIGAIGRIFHEPEWTEPGDVVVWHRGLNPFSGHIGLVLSSDKDGIVTTIEGNVGPFPSKVKQLKHDTHNERVAFFASLRQ